MASGGSFFVRSNVAGIFLLALVFLISCKKEKQIRQFPLGSNPNINSWILDSMKTYYYWNKQLPKNVDLEVSPFDFFPSLKNTEDKYSVLFNSSSADQFKYSLGQLFGFDIVAVESSAEVYTTISMVVPNSTAFARGLRRGDKILAINSVPLSLTNVSGLIDNSISTKNITLKIEGKAGEIALQGAFVAENSIHASKIIESGNQKIAYLFYNSFRSADVSNLVSLFASFKAKGVEEIVVDLRYNSGGSVPVAAAMATMLCPNILAGDVFVIYKGNSIAGTRKSSFNSEISKLSNINFDQLAVNRLNLKRVFVLTGKNTASASELLINCMRPYISVIQIGEKTYGKDVASFLIKDYRSPVEVPGWEIHPIVFKLYNKNGIGDYPGGLDPDYFADELSLLPLRPFGNEDDPLVQQALSIISSSLASRISSGKASPDIIFKSQKVDGNPLLISKP